MAGVKVTLEFSCDKYSWSEAWWWITAGAATFQNAYAPSIQLAQYRVPLLGVGCQLDRWRLSLFPANRRTFDVFYPSNGGQPSWPADPTGIRYAASRPFTAVLLLLENPNGLQKHTFLAGCPTGLSHTVPGDSTGLQFASVPDFLHRLGQFLDFVSGGSWGWLSRGHDLDAGSRAGHKRGLPEYDRPGGGRTDRRRQRGKPRAGQGVRPHQRQGSGARRNLDGRRRAGARRPCYTMDLLPPQFRFRARQQLQGARVDRTAAARFSDHQQRRR